MSTPSSVREGSLRAGGRGHPLALITGSILLLAFVDAGAASAQQSGAAPAEPIWVDQVAGPAYGYASALVVQGSDVYVATTGHDGATNGPVSLRKYGADGTLSWMRELETGTSDYSALWADDVGVCIAGATRVSLDDPPETFDDSVGFVRCLDPDGNLRWTRYIEAQGEAWAPQVVAYAVAGRPSAVYVVGITSDPLKDCAPDACVGAGGWDAFVRKYSRDGVPDWTRQSETPGTDYSRGVAVDPSGEVSVWGVELSDASSPEYAVHLARYASNGVLRQSATIPLDAQIPYDAGFADSRFCLASQTPDEKAFWGVASDLRCYEWDRKAEPALVWQDSLPDTWVDDVVALPSGLLVAGQAFPPLPGQAGAGYLDGFVRSYDGAGGSWTLEFGTPYNDEASAVGQDASRIFVAGSTGGTMGPGSDETPGGTDAYVARLAEPFTATAGGPYTVDEGSTVRLSASASPAEGHGELTYAWDLDRDGSFETVGQTVAYAPPDGTGEAWTIRVQVTNTYSGGAAVAAATLTVANVAPVVDAVPDVSLELGRPLSRQAAFTDPGADTWTAVIDYGDQSASEVQDLAERTFTLSHSYDAPGTYPVTVTVTDKDGGSGTVRFVVVVSGEAASIGDLIDAIEGLVHDKLLNPGQGASFIAKLRDAQAALDAGDTQAAAEALRAFIHEARAYEKAGSLRDHAQDLIGAADVVIASISS